MPEEKFFSFMSRNDSSSANREDVVEAGPRLRRGETEQDSVDEHVVLGAELRVEADPELDERCHPTADRDPSRVRTVDARQTLQQRALAAAVAPDDAEELACGDLEADVLQRAEGLAGAAAAAGEAPVP